MRYAIRRGHLFRRGHLCCVLWLGCVLWLANLVSLGGCSDDTQSQKNITDVPPVKKHDGDAGLVHSGESPKPLPIEIPPLGLENLDQFFYYSSGPAQLAYKQSSTAARQQNWKVASQQAQEAVDRNPYHLAAHWLLGESLAALGQFDTAVPELLRAVAGDYRRFGDKPLDGDHWNRFLRSTAFKQFDKARGEIKVRRKKLLEDAFLFVGSNRPRTETATAGSQMVTYSRTTHAEVYAYTDTNNPDTNNPDTNNPDTNNPDTNNPDNIVHNSERFIRVSRTAGQAVAFLKSPNKKHLAVVSYSRATGTPESKIRQIDDLAIEVIDTTSGIGIGQRVQLGQAVLARVYFERSQPRIIVERTLRRESKTTTITQHIHWNHGRARATTMKRKPRREREQSSLEISFVHHRFKSEGASQVDADWSQGKSDVIRLQKWRKTVVLPTEVVRDSLRFSPDGTKLVISSPRCGAEPARSWIVFGATGRVRELAETSTAAWKTSTQLVTNHQGQLRMLEIGGSQHALTQAPVIIGLNTYNLPCPPSALPAAPPASLD